MAVKRFENLEPHRSDILAWREEGLTLAQVQTRLDESKGVVTSLGTLSRFLKAAAPNHAVGKPDPKTGAEIDAAALFVELLGETRGRGEETRAAIEHLAGQIRVLNERVKPRSETAASPRPKRSIWPFIYAFSAGVAVALVFSFVAGRASLQLLAGALDALFP